ncbi:MAG: type IV secretory system conjugative DNA transfer family protein [Pseudomonadota bacterium]
MLDLTEDRFGSAGFADAHARKKAKLNKGRGAYIGHDAAGRPCHSDQMSAILLCGGARSLKGSLVVPWLVDGRLGGKHGKDHIVTLDWKGQDTVIAAQQLSNGRFVFAFNPRGKYDLPFNRMNPCSHLVPDSPTLIPDVLALMESWIPVTDPRAAYFQRNAQKIVTAICVTGVRHYGFITLPMLADLSAGFGEATDDWLAFEYEIAQQPEPQINEVALMLQRLRKGTHDGGGWEGIKGEITKSFICMIDPQLREALSPPFDFCFSELTKPVCPPCLVSIMEDLEFAETSGPVVRALFNSALIWKRRALSARPQFWCLQEIGNVGAWPLAQDLATISAGYGIRTAYVVQSTEQLNNLKAGASKVIPNSCGTHIYLGTRCPHQASPIQRQLGHMTLEYPDERAIEQAKVAQRRALMSLFNKDGDPFTAMMDATEQKRQAMRPQKMGRELRGIDEILNEENGKAFVFMPGVLEKPAYLTIRPYWQRTDLRGRYLGDPFHNAPGTVAIRTRFGNRIVREVHEPVPHIYRDWPQYRDSGMWRYVKGYRP